MSAVETVQYDMITTQHVHRDAARAAALSPRAVSEAGASCPVRPARRSRGSVADVPPRMLHSNIDPLTVGRGIDGQSSGNFVLAPMRPAGLRIRYDRAAAFGQIHNRHRDRNDGNRPGPAPDSVSRPSPTGVVCTTAFEVEWTTMPSKRLIKDSQRHQVVLGYWHIQQILGRLYPIRSYRTFARNHGVGVVDAIRAVLTGKP